MTAFLPIYFTRQRDWLVDLRIEQATLENPPQATCAVALYTPSAPPPPLFIPTAIICQHGCDLDFLNAVDRDRHHKQEHQTAPGQIPVNINDRDTRIRPSFAD
ncbi:hypothetical protein BJ508DRAFT_327429 [Ascobolus immersus RN42]|uniref:Uncharacterized protein n=1 Tax=Ascobolus immersus RN42 TaxID=1160509 RepID=A0A3N4IF37_ASCIM|nr:hypothetical protein BJ508DRAFT_327429 [Ascobolus immersus RN42]